MRTTIKRDIVITKSIEYSEHGEVREDYYISLSDPSGDLSAGALEELSLDEMKRLGELIRKTVVEKENNNIVK